MAYAPHKQTLVLSTQIENEQTKTIHFNYLFNRNSGYVHALDNHSCFRLDEWD